MNQIIFWLSAAAFITVAIMRVTDPLLPIIANDFGISVGRASIVVTAFALPYGLLQLVYGPLGDRFGKLIVIVATLSFAAISTFACAFADSIEMLAATRFLAGVGTAAAVPLSMAFIADNFAYEVRQPVIARYLNGLIMGQIAGGTLGAILADLFGWRIIFIIFGIVVGAMAHLLWRFSKHHKETLVQAPLRGRHLFKPYIALLKQRRPRQLITTAAIEGFFFFGASAFIGAHLHNTFDLGYAWIGLVLACFGLGSLIYTSSAPTIIARLGERRMIIVGASIMAASYLALAFAPSWLVCLPILLVGGFGFYVMHNTLQTLATELAPHARGTAVSLFAFALIGGQGLGVAAIGSIVDRFGYSAAFCLSAIVVVLLGAWFQGTLRLAQDTTAVSSN